MFGQSPNIRLAVAKAPATSHNLPDRPYFVCTRSRSRGQGAKAKGAKAKGLMLRGTRSIMGQGQGAQMGQVMRGQGLGDEAKGLTFSIQHPVAEVSGLRLTGQC